MSPPLGSLAEARPAIEAMIARGLAAAPTQAEIDARLKPQRNADAWQARLERVEALRMRDELAINAEHDYPVLCGTDAQGRPLPGGRKRDKTEALARLGKWVLGPARPLVLCGARGVGKTLAAIAWLIAEDDAGRYATAKAIELAWNARNRGRWNEDTRVLERLACARRLVIDEVGADGTRAESWYALGELIDKRQDKRTVTISNLSKEAFLLACTHSMRSRMQPGRAEVVEVRGEDGRL